MTQRREHHIDCRQPSYSLPFYVNLAGAFCLAVLIGLGIYLHQVPYLIGGKSSPGFRVIHVDTNNWNVGCTVLGTAIGLLLSWGFASYDDLLTRRELQRPAGALALYLRPLTSRRGWDQVRRGQYTPTRTLLVLATIVSSLTSATTVAVFGVHTQRIIVHNPTASYSLEQLPTSGGAVRNADNSISFLGSGPGLTLLSSFLYRSAFVRAMEAKGYDYHHDNGNFLTDSNAIGSTTFPTLNTSGIGLNTSSYIQYSGPGDGYHIPTSYTFDRLDAVVFGTIVKVSCTNATNLYNITTTNFGDQSRPTHIREYAFQKGSDVSQSVIQNNGYSRQLNIGSYIEGDHDEPPTHAFFFPGSIFDEPFALRCKYEGYEVLASISLKDSLSPLQVNSTTTYGSPLGVNVTQQLAKVIDQYMTIYSHGSPGGSLADAWVAANYDNMYGETNTVIEALEKVLTDVGQAYFTLSRQSVEAANLVRNDEELMPDNGTFVKMAVAVLRVGGSSPGWFVVYGLLFVTASLGVVLARIQRRVMLWAPQDPVEIVARVFPAAVIGELMPLRYGEHFAAVLRDGGAVNQLAVKGTRCEETVP